MNSETLVNLVILVSIVLFISTFFDTKYILMETTTAGGDMGSDFYPAHYLKTYLFPRLKLVGWAPGWYAGIPMLQFYFLPTFVLMVLMSYLMPLEISFKIVTLLGTFLLPIMTYFSFKLMKFKFPVPIIAAMFSLPFLFMEANSMWGGNIPSTLAGEFSHSFGMAFSILFIGLFYNGFKENKNWVRNSLLFSLITLSHIYTAFFSLFSSGFFFIWGIFDKKKKFRETFMYFFKTYFLAFLLTAFWVLPFLFNMGYTTPYADSWNVPFEQMMPVPMIYFAVLTGITVILGVLSKNDKAMYLGYVVLICLFFFFIAEHINLINIRFMSFVQLLVMLVPACLFEPALFSKLKPLKGFVSRLRHWTIPLIVLLLVIFFVQNDVTFIKDWVKWNYEGFENKALWRDYKGINDFVSGDFSDPRVVYEHSDQHNQYGTTRAFELLPYFSGRSTLEGLFMQSSISSPFIFYIQSEIGEQSSCPFWNIYTCAPFDLRTGTKHLEMFNVKHFIVRSEKVKIEIQNFSEYQFLTKIGEIEIYELTTNKNQYVIVPDYEPLVYAGDDWKNFFYEWFKDYNLLDVPIISSNERVGNFNTVENLHSVQMVPLDAECFVNEEILNEEVRFTTNCIGQPHIVRISYHPNWKVEGADEIHLVSPSFMLVIPEEREVRMWYGKSWIDILGCILTLAGVVFLVYTFLRSHNVIKFRKR